MKLVSIRKYLDRPGAAETSAGAPDCLPFCHGLLALLGQHSGAADPGEWTRLAPAWENAPREAPAQAILDQVKALWEQQAGGQVEQARQKAADLQTVLEMFQEALLNLAGHSEQNVGRLEKIQGSLATAVRGSDISQIKRNITETLLYVRAQIEEEKSQSTATTGRLEADLAAARATLLRATPDLEGRPEALAELERRAASAQAGEEWIVAANLERLNVVTQRFTSALTEDLVRTFANRLRKETGRVYRWDDSTLVGIGGAASDVADLRARLEDRIGLTFEHRAVVNGRKVMLAQPVRWMCTGLTGQPVALLAEQIDRLERGPVRW
jgi:hypothetical protein